MQLQPQQSQTPRRIIPANFALELKEQLAQTLTAFVTSILTQPRGRLNTEEAVEPPLRQIIDVLQQVMCTHDAESIVYHLPQAHPISCS